jgi:prephenate dehydrogenase
MTSIGIIGYGQFGQFMAYHLSQYFDVLVYDKEVKDERDPFIVAFEDVCACPAVIFAVPLSDLEDAAREVAKRIHKDALIIDVTSVKERPLEILKKHFPGHEILGTHPIFGPQSGKDGIVGFPIVLSNVSFSDEHYAAVKSFCADRLKLKIVERTPEQHDREIAIVMGLSHFIGRALKHLDIQDYETNTFSYHQLVELRDLLKEDSWELFETIQKGNPYAQEVREQFMQELQSLQERLGE